MKIEDQFDISGRGLVLTGTLDKDEPRPRIGTAPCAMPDGSYIALMVVGIESHKILTDPPRMSQNVSLKDRKSVV